MGDFDIQGGVDARGGKQVSESFAKAAASAPDRASKPQSKQWRHLRLATHVAFVFHHPRSYKKEGDPHMETAPMLEARQQLKRSDKLRALVQRFWSIIDMLKESDGTLARSSYVLLNKKLQKAMVADYDEREAQHDAEVDWRRDIAAARDRRVARGESSNATARGMEFEDFFESMYELADMWTDTVQDGHYSFFFEQVLKAVVKNINANELQFKPTEDIETCESFVPQSQAQPSLAHRSSQSSPSHRSSRSSLSHRSSFRRDGSTPSGAQSNSGSGTVPLPTRARKASHLGGRAQETVNRLRARHARLSQSSNDSDGRALGAGGRRPSVLPPVNENDSAHRHNRRRSSTIHGNLRFLADAGEAEALAQLSPRARAEALAKLPPQARAEALAQLSPRSRAAALAQLSPRSRSEALATLSPRALAEALALLSPRAQPDALAQLSPRSRAEALAQLSPRARAEVMAHLSPRAHALALAQLSPRAREQALAQFSPRARARVQALAQLSPRARAEALAQLSPQTRAEALAQLSPRARAEALTQLSPRARADRLAQLSPRARADRLAQLSPRARAEALAQLSSRARAEALAQMSSRARAAALAQLSPRAQADMMKLMRQLSLRRGVFNRPFDVPSRQTMSTPSHARSVSDDVDADELRLTSFVFPPASAPRAASDALPDSILDRQHKARKTLGSLRRRAHRVAAKRPRAIKTIPATRSPAAERRLRKPRRGVNSTLTLPTLMLRPPPL